MFLFLPYYSALNHTVGYKPAFSFLHFGNKKSIILLLMTLTFFKSYNLLDIEISDINPWEYMRENRVRYLSAFNNLVIFNTSCPENVKIIFPDFSPIT